MYRTALLFLLFAACTVSSYASIIEVNYSGFINRMYFADCTNLSNGTCSQWENIDISSSNFFDDNIIDTQELVRGSYLYNTEFGYTLSGDGVQAIYTDAISDYAISFGQTSIPNSVLPRSQIGDSLSIVNNRNIGTYLFDSFFASTWFSQGDWFASSSISLADNTGQIYSNFDVPETGELADFSSAIFNFGFLYRPTGDQLQISGDITELTFSPYNTSVDVSEPAGLAFYSLVLCVLIRRKLIVS